ncbi:MAG: HAMP domain-containing histidine kinase, partial [Actinomycetota bacterium]|nr:HAMP domain-containing histidine kinase [Actinomycetota bacterium]
MRRRLLLSVVGAVAAALVLLIGAFNVVLGERLNHEANSALVARASAELASLHIVNGRLAVPEVADAAAPDTQAWVFAGERVLEQPRTGPALERAAEQLTLGGRSTLDPPGTHLRLYAVPVATGGYRLGTVVAAVSLAPYRDSAQTALIASIVLGVVLLATVAVAARLLISGALRPVAHMTTQAAAWNQVDSGQRFHQGPPRDELTQLAATLDGLLDRVASSLRHEQRFSAELSHELRSPLASVIAEAQLALRHGRTIDEHRAGYERVLAAAQQMRRTLETLLTAARIEHEHAHAVGDAAAAARAAATGCAELAARSGVTIMVEDPHEQIRVGVETNVAERVLGPLIENACRYGASSVRIGIERRTGAVMFTVQDDGPGVSEQNRERVFEPGWRDGSDRRPNGHGAGLGLPLAR